MDCGESRGGDPKQEGWLKLGLEIDKYYLLDDLCLEAGMVVLI